MLVSLSMCGQIIRQLRNERFLTQRELAKLIRRSQGNVSRLENGKIKVTYDTLLLIARKLDVPVSRLLPGPLNGFPRKAEKTLTGHRRLKKCKVNCQKKHKVART